MEDFFTRILDGFGVRIDGPMKFRLFLQPIMSLIFAIRAGIRDSKTGETPFLVRFLKNKEERKLLLKELWKDVGKVFIFAIIMDVIFQIIVMKTVHPLGSIMTGIILAIIPYLIFRGLITRIIMFFKKNKTSSK